MRKENVAKIALVIATMNWGCSYFMSKIVMEYMGLFTMVSQRFILGFIFSAILLRKHLIGLTIEDIKQSFYLGTSLFLAVLLSTYGVKYTTASNAGFLSCLNIIIIPIIYTFIFKKKISKKMIFSVILCFVGMELLMVTENFTIHKGDFLCILSAFLFSMVIILGDKYAKINNPIKLGVLELGVVAAISSIFSPFVEDYSIPYDIRGIFVIVFLGIICTALCYVLQIYAQKNVQAVEAGLILALEPLFSAVFSFIFLNEILSIKGYIGGIIVFISVIIGGIL